ncbi:MAG: hypothetical protein WBI74_00580 [Caldicoprobacterales bacterium]
MIHDRDSGVEGAEKFNKSIENAVGNDAQISKLEECLEDCLGYKEPSSNKPYRVFVETSKWTSWDDIPIAWRQVFAKAFDIEDLVKL